MSAPARVTRYRITARRDVPAPRLSLALVADLHACRPFMDLPRIRALVAQTNALGADMILLLGDYVGHVYGGRSLPPEPVTEALAQLSAPLGVFAVFGNHDWKDDRQARATGDPTIWHRAFAARGLPCLNNDALTIEAPGGAFTLAGLDSQRAFRSFWHRDAPGADRLDQVLPKLDPARFTLLMAHEPDIFPELPGHIDLTVSGHTHGGQILPFGQPLVVPSRFGTRYAYGHTEEEGRQLVVSGGLGCSGPPFRYRRPPELVLLEIA